MFRTNLSGLSQLLNLDYHRQSVDYNLDLIRLYGKNDVRRALTKFKLELKCIRALSSDLRWPLCRRDTFLAIFNGFERFDFELIWHRSVVRVKDFKYADCCF